MGIWEKGNVRLKGMLEGKEYGIGNSEMQYGEKGDMEKEGKKGDMGKGKGYNIKMKRIGKGGKERDMGMKMKGK